MLKTLPIFLLVAVVYCQSDLDSVFDEIFGPGASTNQAGNETPSSQTQSNSEPGICKFTDGQQGECVKYYLCKNRNDAVTVTECPEFFDVCCSASEKIRDGPVHTTSTLIDPNPSQ